MRYWPLGSSVSFCIERALHPAWGVGSLTVLVLLAMAGFVMVYLLSSRRQE